MTNPSKRDAAARKVVSVARAIVTFQVGLPEGCKRMSREMTSLESYETGLPTIFGEYMNAATGLPLGTERLHWDRAVLRERDVMLEGINQSFRDRVFDTCWALIDRFQDE